MSAKDDMREQAAAARAAAAAEQKKRDRLIAIIGGAVIAAVIAGIGVYYVTRPSKPTCVPGTSICEDRTAAVPATANPTDYGVPAYPLKSGVPTVDLYEDFQCPICGDFEPQNGKRLMQWAAQGKINLIWRPATFLDANLASDNAKNGNPDSSVRATSAFGCAIDAGKGTAYHAAIFGAQPKTEGFGYSDKTLVALGAKVGITGAAKVTFDDCVATGKYRQWALNSYTQFIKNGMNGTPTVVIDGKTVDSSISVLNAAGTGIDTTGTRLWEELKKAGAK